VPVSHVLSQPNWLPEAKKSFQFDMLYTYKSVSDLNALVCDLSPSSHSILACAPFTCHRKAGYNPQQELARYDTAADFDVVDPFTTPHLMKTYATFFARRDVVGARLYRSASVPRRFFVPRRYTSTSAIELIRMCSPFVWSRSVTWCCRCCVCVHANISYKDKLP